MRTNPTPTSLSEVETGSELHNIVALTPQKKLFQVVVEKEQSAGAPPNAPGGAINRGDYRGAVKLEPTDKPSRLVRGLAGESLPDSTESYQSGMAFGILPLRSDPTPASGSSYLLNARRLNPRTVWSYGPWNAVPDVPENLRVDREILLVAKADGQIVKIDLSAAQALGPSDLDRNPDVWRLLRNGLVVGKVEYNDGTSKKKSVSLINLASFGDSKDTDLAPQAAFTGTWDFKWPRGSAIRVRLKGGTPEAQSEVKKLASEWLSADPSQNPGNLSFVFLDANTLAAGVDYDVLVSLEALPSRDDNNARLPQSDLGTYCQRSPLNLPTTYVGCPEGGIKTSNGTETGDVYFSSPAFKHIVLHEFGHVLGLPHINQHPDFENEIKESADALNERRQAVNDLLFNQALLDEDFMKQNFGMAWPGGTVYSDWPALSAGARLLTFANHIMCALPIEGLLPGNAPGAPLSLSYKTSLTSFDRDWLIQMYGAPSVLSHR